MAQVEAPIPVESDSVIGSTVQLKSLTVKVGDRTLLSNVSVDLQAGKITLIVGCSGVGKSVLLKILSGEIGLDHPRIHVSGEVLIDGQDILQTRRKIPVGVVYQQFALFDEFSAEDNIRFARQHRHGKCFDSRRSPAEWLAELEVPRHTPVSALSGGQQQRLAIARTLAAGPDVVLYDEPTSGLDSVTARRVASLIRDTHASHRQTSLIVTHDYHSLPPIADRILVLDPESQRLIDVDSENWSNIEQSLHPPGGHSADTGSSPSLTQCVTDTICGSLEATSRAVEELAMLPLRCLPLWKSPTWGGRYVWHYLKLVSGLSAAVYIAISGLIIGFVATYFTFRFLPYANYTKPLLIENLLSSIGFALYRILVPVLATILIAARCGAAVASDIGGKRYGRQIDAMRTFGVEPGRYLLTGVLYAFLVGTPVLTAIGYGVAHLTSLVVFVSTHGNHGPAFWDQHFRRDLVVPDQWLFVGTGWLLAKLLACGVGIALVSYHMGAQPKHSAHDVSRGITRAILWSTLYVLIVHFTFTFFEFD